MHNEDSKLDILEALSQKGFKHQVKDLLKFRTLTSSY